MEWNSHIFHAIIKLQNNKKQPNENFIYNYILKTVESLTTEKLEDRLANKFENNHIVERTHILL